VVLPRPPLLVLVVLILRSVAVGSVHEQAAKTKAGRKTKEFGTPATKGREGPGGSLLPN